MANLEFDYLDKDERVGDSNFTIGFVLQSLDQFKNNDEWIKIVSANKNENGKYEINKVNVTQISGIGFFSHIYRIQFYFANAIDLKHKLTNVFSVILKVIFYNIYFFT